MKITVHLFASDDDGGTQATAFATEREADDALLEAIGHDREAFEAWLKENPEGDIWEFKDEEGEHDHSLDTYNIDEESIDFDLCAQPLPSTGREQVAEALECLKRARDLLKASANRQTLQRVQAAISSCKGAARIQIGREQRADEARRRNMELDPFTADGQRISEAHGWRICRSDGAAIVFAIEGMGRRGFGGDTVAERNANATAHVRFFGKASRNEAEQADLLSRNEIERVAYYRLCGKALAALEAADLLADAAALEAEGDTAQAAECRRHAESL